MRAVRRWRRKTGLLGGWGYCEGGLEALGTISEKWNEDKLSLDLDGAVGGSC